MKLVACCLCNDVVPGVCATDGSDEFASGVVTAGLPYHEVREVHFSDHNEPIALGREVVRDEFVHMRLVRTR